MMMMLVVACVDTIHHLCGVPGNPLVAEQIRSLCLQWSRVSTFSMGWVFMLENSLESDESKYKEE